MNSSFFLRYVARFLASQIPQLGLWALHNANNIQFQKRINRILFDLASEGVAACQVNYTDDIETPYLQGFNEAGFPLGFGELPDYTPTNYTTSFSYYPSRNIVGMGEVQDRIFWGFAFLILLTGAAATGIKFFLDRHKPHIRELQIEIEDLENTVANLTIDETMEQHITDNIISLFRPVLRNFSQESEALNELGLMDSVNHQFIGLDPVVFPDGHSISRATLNELIASSQDKSIRSPQTNVSYSIDTVNANHFLRHIATTLAKDCLPPQVQNAINTLEPKRAELDTYTQPTIWNKLVQFTYLGGISAFILLVDNIFTWNLTPAFIRERTLYEFEQNCCNVFLNTTGLIPNGPQALFNSGNESGVLAGQCSATENDITVCNPRYFSLPANSLSGYCSLPSSQPTYNPLEVILFCLWFAQIAYFSFMHSLHLWLDQKDSADMTGLPVVRPEERQLLPSSRSDGEEIVVLNENRGNLQEAYEPNMVCEKMRFFTNLCNPNTSMGKKAREYLDSNKDVTIPDSNTKDYASSAFFNHARALRNQQQAEAERFQLG